MAFALRICSRYKMRIKETHKDVITVHIPVITGGAASAGCGVLSSLNPNRSNATRNSFVLGSRRAGYNGVVSGQRPLSPRARIKMIASRNVFLHHVIPLKKLWLEAL